MSLTSDLYKALRIMRAVKAVRTGGSARYLKRSIKSKVVAKATGPWRLR